MRGQQDAPRFVQPDRLASDAALGRDFTDKQSVPLHEASLQPAPWGKVKTSRPAILAAGPGAPDVVQLWTTAPSSLFTPWADEAHGCAE